MNRRTIFSRALVVSLFLLSCFEVSAQRKLLDNDARSRIESVAAEKSRTLSRRSREKKETFVNGVIVKTVEVLHEGTFDGKQHSVTKTIEEGQIDKKEVIIIGETLYFRDFTGVWKRSEEKVVWQLPSGTHFNQPPVGSQHSVATVVLNGLPMQLSDSFLVNNENNELNFQHRQVWIGEDGLVYKIEMTKGNLSPRTLTYRSIETYEYDPKIKIEAPQVK